MGCSDVRVKFDAEAGSFWNLDVAILNQWVVVGMEVVPPVDVEGVVFEDVEVRDSGPKVDTCQCSDRAAHAVRGEHDVVFFGAVCDCLRFGESTTSCWIRGDDVDAEVIEEVFEFVDAESIFPRRDGCGCSVGYVALRIHIFGGHEVFEPHEIVGFESVCESDRAVE